jgi:Sulfotransferase family
MSKYYFNHIPKTGGNTVKKQLNNLGLDSKETKLKQIKSKFYLMGGHFGMGPVIENPNMQSFTMLRNPMNRVISNFATISGLFFTKNETLEEQKKFFESWIMDDKNMLIKSNFQTRNLTKGTKKDLNFYKNDKFYKSLNEYQKSIYSPFVGWGIEDTEIDFNDAEKNFKNMILVGTTEKHITFMKNLVDIFNQTHDLGLNANLLKEEKVNDNPLSEYFAENISNVVKKRIIELNNWDYYFWELASKNE